MAIPTDGVRDRLSGSSAISFIMFANRTGSSFRKKIYDFFSHAFRPVAEKKTEQNRMTLTTELYCFVKLLK